MPENYSRLKSLCIATLGLSKMHLFKLFLNLSMTYKVEILGKSLKSQAVLTKEQFSKNKICSSIKFVVTLNLFFSLKIYIKFLSHLS